jgi:hypothetical protein
MLKHNLRGSSVFRTVREGAVRKSTRGVIESGLPHLGSGSTECRTDAVFENARGFADLLISLAVEMIHGDEICFLGGEFSEEPFDFISIEHGLFGGGPVTGLTFGGLARSWVGKRGHRPVLEHLGHDDAAGHDRQVGCQTGLATKVSKNGKIVLYQVQKDLGTHVLPIVGAEADASGTGGVIDDVYHQPEEPIDEILPRPGFLVQAPFEEITVDLGEAHGKYPRVLSVRETTPQMGASPRP